MINLFSVQHADRFSALAQHPTSVWGRSFRVCCLVAAVTLMSLADLHMTLTHAKGIGFAEANPLARWIMSFNCAWLLGTWKVLFVALTAGILLILRQTRSAEIGAWFSLGVMLWLMGQWQSYSDKVHALTPVMHQLSAAEMPNFVRMSE